MLQRHEERSQRSRHFSNSSFAFFYQVSHRCFSYQYHRLLNPSRHVFFTFIVFSHSVAPCPAILVIRFCFTALTRRFLTLSADAVSFIPLFCSVYIPSVPWQWILNSFQGQQLAKVHIRTIKPILEILASASRLKSWSCSYRVVSFSGCPFTLASRLRSFLTGTSFVLSFQYVNTVVDSGDTSGI